MKKFLQEFKTFALRGNVMDLAVGVMIGAAFQDIVKSLTEDVLSPLVGLFVKTDFSMLAFTVNGVEVRYGAFITAVVNFVLLAFLIFLLIKGINKLASLHKNPAAPVVPTVKVCPYCLSEIPIAATRCGHCTSMLSETESAADETPDL